MKASLYCGPPLQPCPRTARLLEETTAAYPVPPTLLTPANRTAASAAGWPFGRSRPLPRRKASAMQPPKWRCRAWRSFQSVRGLEPGLRPSPRGSFRKSAVRVRLTAESPPAATPRTLEVSPPTQAAWTSPLGKTLAPFSICLPTWLKTWVPVLAPVSLDTSTRYRHHSGSCTTLPGIFYKRETWAPKTRNPPPQRKTLLKSRHRGIKGASRPVSVT